MLAYSSSGASSFAVRDQVGHGRSIGGVLITFLAFFGDRVLHMDSPTLLETLDVGGKL